MVDYRNQLRRAIEIRKQYLIKKLVWMGVYESEDTPKLYDLTLSELEQEWKSAEKKNSEDGAG